MTTDITSADGALYSSMPFGQTQRNAFFFLNNNYGRGNFVNGVDYMSTLMAHPTTFPLGSLMQWRWPAASSGAPFAYAYPEIIYGGTPYGNPYNMVGPWPQKVRDNRTFIANYEVALGGNTNSYNVLIDVYVTALPNSVDGTHVAEISFFPHWDNPSNLTNIHAFTWGRASVTRQGQQILIRPVTDANTPRDMLNASIDMKEVFTYLASLGWITGNEYLRGAEFGAEVQVPNVYNSAPHQGSLQIIQLSYTWN